MKEPTIQQIIDDQEQKIGELEAIVKHGDEIMVRNNFHGIMKDAYVNRTESCTGAELTNTMLAKLDPVLDSISPEDMKAMVRSYLVAKWLKGMVQMMAMEQLISGMPED